MLEIGTQAPRFSLADQDGIVRSLEDYRGQKVVLYFYMRDMRSGCTSQACSFADAYPQFQEKGATVLGVSADIRCRRSCWNEYGLSGITRPRFPRNIILYMLARPTLASAAMAVPGLAIAET